MWSFCAFHVGSIIHTFGALGISNSLLRVGWPSPIEGVDRPWHRYQVSPMEFVMLFEHLREHRDATVPWQKWTKTTWTKTTVGDKQVPQRSFFAEIHYFQVSCWSLGCVSSHNEVTVMMQFKGLMPIHWQDCWWLKSCTNWDVSNPLKIGIIYLYIEYIHIIFIIYINSWTPDFWLPSTSPSPTSPFPWLFFHGWFTWKNSSRIKRRFFPLETMIRWFSTLHPPRQFIAFSAWLVTQKVVIVVRESYTQNGRNIQVKDFRVLFSNVFFNFHPIPGEVMGRWSNLTNVFLNGLVQPPTSLLVLF